MDDLKQENDRMLDYTLKQVGIDSEKSKKKLSPTICR